MPMDHNTYICKILIGQEMSIYINKSSAEVKRQAHIMGQQKISIGWEMIIFVSAWFRTEKSSSIQLGLYHFNPLQKASSYNG